VRWYKGRRGNTEKKKKKSRVRRGYYREGQKKRGEKASNGGKKGGGGWITGKGKGKVPNQGTRFLKIMGDTPHMGKRKPREPGDW